MTVREITLQLLDDYENSGKYVNLSLSSHLTDKLTREDRSFLTALLYTSVEHKITYDYIIASLSGRGADRIDIHTLNILRLGLCQILAMDSIPDYAAVNETVKLARNRGERSFVNGVLRSAVRAKEEGCIPMPDRRRNAARYLSIAYSFPLWITKHFIGILGEEETEQLFAAFNSQAYTDLTVNLCRISREELLLLLHNDGVDAVPSSRSSLSIRIGSSVDPTRLVGFDKGYFFVQDEVCALAAEALEVRAGDRIVDVCACPGGKSFAAAILGGSGSYVLSLDLHESKLSLIDRGARRMGINSITVGERDALYPREDLLGSFDRVICDVPCSGLGVLGKKPDMRYRDETGIKELPELQLDILTASSSYLRDGGIIVYSTCTLNPEENGRVVETFLREHPDFAPIDFSFGELSSSDGMLTTYPHRHHCDGFFIAKMRKQVK